MSRLKPLWTVTLILILFMGALPFLLNGIGHLIAATSDCDIDKGALCEWGIRLPMFIFFGFGTIPAMFISLGIWAVAKAILCPPNRAKTMEKA